MRPRKGKILGREKAEGGVKGVRRAAGCGNHTEIIAVIGTKDQQITLGVQTRELGSSI